MHRPQPRQQGLLSSRLISSHESGQQALHVENEASFKLPDVEQRPCALWNLLTVDPSVMQEAVCWAFLPHRRFFVRGGYRDGSLVFGFAQQQHASVLEGAHDAPVTAVAADGICASYVPGSHGLLLLAGTGGGEVSLWGAREDWKGFAAVSRWRVHMSAVSCVDFGDWCGLALSAGEDGAVHVYRVRPPARPLRTFLAEPRAPVRQARFGTHAPCTVVACSVPAAGPARVHVWALHGFLLATLELGASSVPRGLRVVCDGDAREGLLCITDDGQGGGCVELLSLPYLQPVWRRRCHGGARPAVLDSSPDRRMLWVGHQDGSFEAVYA